MSSHVALPPGSGMGTGQAKLRLVVVDDQPLVCLALAELIQNAEGMEVVATAGRVDEAVRCAEEFQPCVVLMDVMPESNVFEGVESILARCPRTIVILLDDSPLDANVREALRVGAGGYLTKQQPFGQINTALRQAARGDRVFTPEIARRLVLSADGVRLSMPGREHPLASLTPRETDVLIYLAQGNSVKQCAKVLGIGASTVGNHKSRLMKKLNVHKTVELVHLAIREGLVPSRFPTAQHRASQN